MAKYSNDEINDLIYWLDMNKEEIERQKEFSKQYGAIQRTFFSTLQAVQKKIWYGVLLIIIATALGISI